MLAIIKPSRIGGKVSAPPSKSYAHRLMIGAALADGVSTLHGIKESEDMLATIDCVRSLGAECTLQDGVLTVRGIGTQREHLKKNADSFPIFPCRESGSTLRFFIPIASTLFPVCTFSGTRRLIQRGIGVYERIFHAQGISCRTNGETINMNGSLQAGHYEIPGNISSQFVTGLLYALSLAHGESVVHVLPPVESRAYIDMTVQVLSLFGVSVQETQENVFRIMGEQRFCPIQAEAEGDWSNAANLLALNQLFSEDAVTVTGLCDSSLQGDRKCLDLFEWLKRSSSVIDLSGCPDLAPILFAVAAEGHGATFIGTRRLRIKESDRASVMAEELLKFGIQADVGENSVIVRPGEIHAPTQMLSGHNDHRIVMALSVLCCKYGGQIQGAQAVRKSYPDFFRALRELGAEVDLENEI